MISNFRIKLKKVTDIFSQTFRRYDVRQLKDKQIKEAFHLTLQNRFQDLGEMDENETEQPWSKNKYIYRDTAEEILGFRNPLRKDWMTEKT
jgi:hypothetical protein